MNEKTGITPSPTIDLQKLPRELRSFPGCPCSQWLMCLHCVKCWDHQNEEDILMLWAKLKPQWREAKSLGWANHPEGRAPSVPWELGRDTWLLGWCVFLCPPIASPAWLHFSLGSRELGFQCPLLGLLGQEEGRCLPEDLDLGDRHEKAVETVCCLPPLKFSPAFQLSCLQHQIGRVWG